MVFSSIIFLVYFLPLFLIIYFFIPQKFKNYFLLAASFFFYSWVSPKFIFIVLCFTILDFYLVQSIFKSDDKRARKLLLILSVSINLGLLAYFKYANFF